MENKKTFVELYNELPVTPPKTAFVKRMAEITKKSEVSVYRWVTGSVVPDALTKSVIATELGVEVDVLFPSEN